MSVIMRFRELGMWMPTLGVISDQTSAPRAIETVMNPDGFETALGFVIT